MRDALRFMIVLNKGRSGVPLHKLGSISENCNNFLKYLSEDIEINTTQGEWIAVNFKNGSLACDIEYVGETTEYQRKDYMYYLKNIMVDPMSAINGKIKRKTIFSYANIAKPLDHDEFIEFGIYNNNGHQEPVSMFTLSKKQSCDLVSFAEETLNCNGALQGKIHEFYPSGEKPYFKLRPLSTKYLVKCYFKNSLYDEIIGLLKKRDAVIHVSGMMVIHKSDKKIDSLYIESKNHLQIAEEYIEGDINKLKGLVPNVLESENLQNLMNLIRNRE